MDYYEKSEIQSKLKEIKIKICKGYFSKTIIYEFTVNVLKDDVDSEICIMFFSNLDVIKIKNELNCSFYNIRPTVYSCGAQIYCSGFSSNGHFITRGHIIGEVDNLFVETHLESYAFAKQSGKSSISSKDSFSSPRLLGDYASSQGQISGGGIFSRIDDSWIGFHIQG